MATWAVLADCDIFEPGDIMIALNKLQQIKMSQLNVKNPQKQGNRELYRVELRVPLLSRASLINDWKMDTIGIYC